MRNFNHYFILIIEAATIFQASTCLGMDENYKQAQEQRLEQEKTRKRVLENGQEPDKKRQDKGTEKEEEVNSDKDLSTYEISPTILSCSAMLKQSDEIVRENKGITSTTAYPRRWQEIKGQKNFDELWGELRGFVQLCGHGVSEQEKLNLMSEYGLQNVADMLVVNEMVGRTCLLPQEKKVLENCKPLFKKIVPTLKSLLPVEKFGSDEDLILSTFNGVLIAFINQNKVALTKIFLDQKDSLKVAFNILRVADFLGIEQFDRLFEAILPQMNILNSNVGKNLKLVFEEINYQQNSLTYEELQKLFEQVFGFVEKMCGECYVEKINKLIAFNLIKSNVRPELLFDFKRLNAGDGNGIESAVFSPQGEYIIASTGGGPIYVWNVQTGKLERTLTGHPDTQVSCVACSPDGKNIVSCDYEDHIKVWNLQTGTCLRTMTGHPDLIEEVAYSPDGNHIVSGSREGQIRIWNAQTGELVRILAHQMDDASLWVVRYLPHGNVIVSAADQTIKIWDAQTGQCLHSLSEPIANRAELGLSSDGRYLISANSLNMWDVQTGERVGALQWQNGTGHATSVSYSLDGKFIVSGWSDCTARVWDGGSSRFLFALNGHRDLNQNQGMHNLYSLWLGNDEWTDHVDSALFSPDGNQIIALSSNPTIKVWTCLLKKLKDEIGL